MNPKVSVIIPIYNVEKYLRKCLDSIKNQTLKEIEVLCVNDASTDSSRDIVKEYVKEDSRFILFDNLENRGQSYARNLGLEVAKGIYVQFLDSDDWLDTNALEILSNKMDEERLDVIQYDRKTIYEVEELKKVYTYRNRNKNYGKVYAGPELFCAQFENGDSRTSPAVMMSRAEFLRGNRIRFYEGIIHEDEIFCFHAFLSAKRIMCLSNTFYNRLVRAGSTMTKKKSKNNLRGYLIGYFELTKIFFELKIDETRYCPIVRNYILVILNYILDITKRFEMENDLRSMRFHNKFYDATLQTILLSIDINQLSNCVQKNEFIFPFHLIEDGSCVVICGAGEIGINFYKQLTSCKRVKCLCVVDEYSRRVKLNNYELEVYKLEVLSKMKFDYIVIATQDKKKAINVQKKIINMGIKKNRIKWDGENYSREKYYNNVYFPVIWNKFA